MNDNSGTMNYLSLILGFERWLETNYLPSLAQLLWYKIVALDNRCGWAEWITVDNHRLMSLMQMSREATFIDVRNKLIDAGLIEYRKGKKGSPNQYKICTFKYEVQTVVQTEVNTVVNTVAQTVDINKHKQKQKYIAHVRTNKFNDFSQRDINVSDIESKLLSNNSGG